MSSFVYKLISRPLLPVKGTWIDAVFFILAFLLLCLASFSLFNTKRAEWPRFLVRSIAAFVFVILVFFCVCLLRTSIYGFSQLGWDDLVAFGNLFMFVMIAAFTLVMGRIFCGWVCPFGFLQEAAYRLFPIRQRKTKIIFLLFILSASFIYFYFLKPATDFFTENVIALWAMGLLVIILLRLINPKLEPFFQKIKYISLALYILVLGVFVFFSEAWCPIYGGEIDYSSTLAFFVIVASSCVLCMSWCRYLCPTGVFLSLLSRVSMFKIKSKSESTPLGGGKKEVCPMGALHKDKIDPANCIWCGRCIRQCGNKLDLR